jgi:hypothetical protein
VDNFLRDSSPSIFGEMYCARLRVFLPVYKRLVLGGGRDFISATRSFFTEHPPFRLGFNMRLHWEGILNNCFRVVTFKAERLLFEHAVYDVLNR